jgi:ribosome-associated protein
VRNKTTQKSKAIENLARSKEDVEMDDTLDPAENSISKSQKKRNMIALQSVGEELVALSTDVINKMDLPDELRVAILDAKRIPNSKHGGNKRQMQYIGRLMREVDPAPILAQLQALKAPNQKQTAQHHLAERWRERMLVDATSVAAFVREFPEADQTMLEKYLAAAKDDHAKQRPPKNFRLLYQTLHKHIVNQFVSHPVREQNPQVF